MNESDSERMSSILDQMGYISTENNEEADILLINTCCIRETAENKVYGLLGRLKKIKEKDPGKIIAIGGCMTQIEETALHIKKRFPYVNIVFGTSQLHQLPELIEKALNERKKTTVSHCQPEGIVEGITAKRKNGIKAWVPIIHGCNNFCTYCIVPHVRGRERSRQPENIINEIEQLVGQGFKEVTLLGQNVNSYGKDFEKKFHFSDLLMSINQIKGLLRVRFMTSHPRDFSEDLIDAIGNASKVCEHLHLPVQSGSDKILKAMNRGYNKEYYLSLIAKIKEMIPEASITTDIMVGFPGETELDFLDTMEVVEKARYDSAFTFIYNKRKGTPAESMPNQVPEEEKTKRIALLIKRQNEISLAKNKAEAGNIHQVLVDGVNQSKKGIVSGRTRTNKLVILPGSEKDIGNMFNVNILNGTLSHLEGKLVKAPL